MNRMNTTRFMSQEELMQKYTEIDLSREEPCPAGGVPLLVKNQKAYVDTEDNHTMIFGSTGSKKTRLLGIPTVEILSRAGESFIVTDPKGEIYAKTAKSIQRKGYRTYCLNLRELKKGVTWNPLLVPYDFYCQGNAGKAVEMVYEMVRMIVGEKSEDPFWSNTTIDVITGLILILLENAGKEECNIKSVLALWSQYVESKEEFIQKVRQNCSDLVVRKLNSLNNESTKTVGSIEALVTTGLNRLSANEEFVEFLSQDGMKFDSIASEKTAIFIIVPDENKFYHFIASLFMEQMYEVLIKQAQHNPNQRLPIRMNYIIDEFANIPKMENMDSMITASRSRNIRFMLLIQSKKQLEEKYGSAASIICDNCSNWIYLYSKDYELLKEISQLCGNVIYDNLLTIPLISEFELQHLSKEEGEALVLAGRSLPCIVNLADIDEYPYLQDCSDILETQTWTSVDTFVLGTKKLSTYFLQSLPQLNRSRRNKARTGTRDKWLVGTCNGVILVEDSASLAEIISGYGMIRLCVNEFDDLSCMKNMQWYISDNKKMFRYAYILANEAPERIAVTIQELGEEEFTPVPESTIERLKGAGLC